MLGALEEVVLERSDVTHSNVCTCDLVVVQCSVQAPSQLDVRLGMAMNLYVGWNTNRFGNRRLCQCGWLEVEWTRAIFALS